ncbi:hypothetical protein [Amycolatopsis sp. NPDC059657]|uniref:hypothetical protein n=1 Tax=Amycolatopsis sp. NPDC059657 TaxID=3346899 RepID=UPI00366F7C5A
MRRAAAAVAVTLLAVLGCAACQDEASSGPATETTTAPGELGAIQSMLDSIDADMAGDG